MENKGKWIPTDPDFKIEGALENFKKCRESKEYQSFTEQAKMECDTLMKAYEGDAEAREETRKWYGLYESEIEAWEKTMTGWICSNLNKDYMRKRELEGQAGAKKH